MHDDSRVNDEKLKFIIYIVTLSIWSFEKRFGKPLRASLGNTELVEIKFRECLILWIWYSSWQQDQLFELNQHKRTIDDSARDRNSAVYRRKTKGKQIYV